MSKYDNWRGSSYVGSRKWLVTTVRKYERKTGTEPVSRKEIRAMSDADLRTYWHLLWGEWMS